MSTFTISSSDEEILKALTIADEIGKEFANNSTSGISYNIPPFQIEGSEKVFTESNTSDSEFNKSSDLLNETYESFKFDLEFQAISQDIKELYVMNDLFNERKRTLEEENTSYIKDTLLSGAEILSDSILDQRLHNINLVLKHIKTIIEQMPRIKQVLQDERKNTLKVSPSCQKDVIQFFQISDALIKKMLEDASLFENFDINNVTKVIPINENALHSKLHNIIAELAKRIDLLTEFRSHLSTAEDFESGIELGISELCKSDNTRIQIDQISSADSGLC